MNIGYGMTVTMYTMPQLSILPAHVKSDAIRNKIITYGAGCMASKCLPLVLLTDEI